MMAAADRLRLVGWVQYRMWQRLGPRPSRTALDVVRNLADLYRAGRCHAFLGEDDGTLRFELAGEEPGADVWPASTPPSQLRRVVFGSSPDRA